jgi:two-component system OmpR family sensor kinase
MTEADADLASFLKDHRIAILQRWQRRVAATIEVMSISRIQLLDHMPKFVDGIIAALATPPAAGDPTEAAAQRFAPAHGAQRLEVGFDVDEVVREYGILADVFVEILRERDGNVKAAWLRLLLAATNAGAAEAVGEYVRQRDAEIQRQQARHRAFIAHELRTPIAGVMAAAAVLARLDGPVAESQPFTLLRRNLDKLRELVDQVLIAGRLEAGVEPVRAHLDLAALLRGVVETLHPEAEMMQVRIVLDAPPELDALIDRNLIESAIANLLRNGIKYTKPGSAIEVTLSRDGDDIVTRVADACGGITATNWTNLFEPFERGDGAVEQRRDGLGLGLAIAKQAVEAHGGTVSMRNNPPDGCVFEIRIPAGGLSQ